MRAVTYDNRLPIDFALKGFSVDVTENPTVGQLMHQVRGEKVEVTDRGGVVTAGSIVSIERQPAPPMGPPRLQIRSGEVPDPQLPFRASVRHP